MEYKHEKYLLNLFCEFRNPEVEADFMEYEKASSLQLVRILILVMGFAFGLFAISDYYYFHMDSTFIISLILRCIGFLAAISAYFLAGRFTRFNDTLFMITLAEMLIFVIYLSYLYTREISAPTLQLMYVMLQMLTVFLIPNRWKNSLAAGFAIWAGYLIFFAFYSNPLETPALIQQGLYLGVCFVSCSIFLYGRESMERKHFAAEQLLEFMSITDRLTGIYNRGRFEYVLNLWIKNMRHDPFCLLLFDIDDFKRVNDRFGHHAGDKVLVGISEIITANIRDDDIFARWGGEEFVVLLSRIDIDTATELAERLRKAIEANQFSEAGHITISIGLVQYRRGEPIEELMKRVDEKMYQAKREGKNRVSIGREEDY